MAGEFSFLCVVLSETAVSEEERTSSFLLFKKKIKKEERECVCVFT